MPKICFLKRNKFTRERGREKKAYAVHVCRVQMHVGCSASVVDEQDYFQLNMRKPGALYLRECQGEQTWRLTELTT